MSLRLPDINDSDMKLPTQPHLTAEVSNGWKYTLLPLYTRVGPKVSGLTFKDAPNGKCAIYGEVSVSVSVCVEIKGDNIEK